MFGVARTSPPDAVGFIAQLPNDPNDDRRYELAFEIAEHWSNVDAQAALDWVLSVPFPGERNKRPQRLLLSKVLGNLASSDPNLALQAALNDPIGRFGHGLEPFVYIQHRTGGYRPSYIYAVACKGRCNESCFIQIRGEERLQIKAILIELWIWVCHFLTISNPITTVQFSSRWARSDPDSLFKSMDRMPSSLIKAQAAYNLLAKYRNSGVLNDAEVEKLTGHSQCKRTSNNKRCYLLRFI